MSTFNSFEVEVDDPEETRWSYGASDEKGLHKLNLAYPKEPPKKRVLAWWKKYADKMILAIGIILIAAISFEAGFLRGQKSQRGPVVVNQSACAPCPKAENDNGAGNSAQQNNQSKTDNQMNSDNQKCAFVASKNSNKYHLSTCQWAQKIKPENKVCFSSVEEAQKRGYQGAKCCIK